MNIIVHMMFAMTVRKNVKESLGITLNLRGFLLGNILPDISRKYGYHPHYMKDSLSFVIDSKECLLVKKSDKTVSAYRFAKELGAMNHYLSDFFCKPHTEGYDRSKTHHGYYELTMIGRYRKGLRNFRKFLKENEALKKPADLEAFIMENVKNYKVSKQGRANDIGYALYIGAHLSKCMVVYSGSRAPEGDVSGRLLKVSCNA